MLEKAIEKAIENEVTSNKRSIRNLARSCASDSQYEEAHAYLPDLAECVGLDRNRTDLLREEEIALFKDNYKEW